MTHLNKTQIAALACATIALGACKDNTAVPDLNNPSVSSVGGVLTRTTLQTLTTGAYDSDRRSMADYPWIVFPETMARDVLRLDNSESRFETETLEGPPSPGGFLARGFQPYYTSVHAEQFVIDAVPRAAADISTGDKQAIVGFMQTLKALDLYRVLETRDTTGIPLLSADPANLGPVLCKPNALAAISAILDSGYTALQAAQTAGTTTYPGALPTGWTSIGGDYSLVSNQIKFNRGMKGKVELYRGLAGNAASFATSIAALNIALAGVGTTQTDLNGGPYYQYSTASGEVANPNFDSRIHFTPSVHDSLQAGDARASKIVTRSTAATLTVDGTAYSTLYDPAVAVTSNSANQTRPIAILRNAELYALRAQAEVGAGNLPAATTDINVLRVTEGGLAPYATFTSATQAINAILYEKRYSFLVEGPQRLVDLRAYNRLNATSFPKNNKITSFYATDPYNYVLPYTQAELDARGGHITCQ